MIGCGGDPGSLGNLCLRRMAVDILCAALSIFEQSRNPCIVENQANILSFLFHMLGFWARAWSSRIPPALQPCNFHSAVKLRGRGWVLQHEEQGLESDSGLWGVSQYSSDPARFTNL